MSGSGQRAPGVIAVWARRIMPGPRRWWAEAMIAELPYCDPGVRALGFALGCLGAALNERIRWTLRQPDNVRALTVWGAGLLLLAHATVDGSRAWPLLWPLVAGAVVTIIPGRSPAPSRGPGSSSLRRCCTAVRAGSAAGAVAGMIFAVGGAVHLMFAGVPVLEARIPALVAGAASSVAISTAAALACAAMRDRLSRC